ncbi:MAG: hypothetical protein ACHBN1_11960 [Heteroscytonema crispum UTEX LB 1556]
MKIRLSHAQCPMPNAQCPMTPDACSGKPSRSTGATMPDLQVSSNLLKISEIQKDE